MQQKTFKFTRRQIEGYDVFNEKEEEYLAYAPTREAARQIAKANGGRKAGVVIEQVAVLRTEVR